MHGGKIVDELFACLLENPKWVLNHQDDERVSTAILLCSEHRCLEDGYELKLPDWYSNPAIKQHPMFAAAKLNAVLKLRSLWRAQKYQELGHQVREMAQTQRDFYYRHWFASLADELEDVIANQQSSGPFGFNPFDGLFGDKDEDDTFDEDTFDEDAAAEAFGTARAEPGASHAGPPAPSSPPGL